MIGMCGISVAEAAAWLDIAPSTAEQKASGLRGMKADEEESLFRLYRLVRSTEPLADYPDVPAGAILRQLAIKEMDGFVSGKPVPANQLSWPRPSPDVGLEEARYPVGRSDQDEDE